MHSDREKEVVRTAWPIRRVLERFGYDPTSRERGRCRCPICGVDADSTASPNAFSYTDTVCRCHRCGFGGDAFKLWMELSGVQFREAIIEMGGGCACEHRPADAEMDEVDLAIEEKKCLRRVGSEIKRQSAALERVIARDRDAKKAQRMALANLTGRTHEYTIWDEVEIDSEAARRFAMLDEEGDITHSLTKEV